MNGKEGHGPITVQPCIELVEQIHLKAEFGQLLHNERGNLEIDIGLGQRHIAVGIGADRAGIVAAVPGYNSNPQGRFNRTDRVAHGLGGQQ